ncbi:Na+/H+ antiporter subunit E [Boseongicola aestuarii]|jgi:multicomponent Na+:H+ antiporter subunit E|uniref:Na(+)/H(+) antiporter subunit E n=1 Tax=Boseongicola aestuarii TaxID=1470561 RepID=A0A238IXT4_9RHOB|nr:Na+/H+ antiporter subunit E [Boseongicola aestuarii]SMX23278.1 Na(+)/H(+) antiporter subunit E [Boseongicola aestuarii]
MNLFTINTLLAIVWSSLWADFTLMSLATGFVIGYAALWVAQPLFGGRVLYFRRVWRVLKLFAFFLYELVVSSVRVAWDVLTPTQLSNPAIIEMPLDVKSDIEILLVTNLISLTPGTLSLDVSPDRSTLIVHAMFADDPDALIAELKDGMERKVMEVFEQ